MTGDQTEALQQAVRGAASPLRASGQGSKPGPAQAATELSLLKHSGIIAYDPTEMVVQARAGTLLAELQAVLAEQGQMLAFEPPSFAGKGTVGGMFASGLSGPRRPWGGALRDHVLGATCINGRGERLSFGGQVMKNVAGYDVARLLCGSQGALAVILDISVKVLPQPAVELTLLQECSAAEALQRLAAWGRQALPLSAASWTDGQLRLRLSGAEPAVTAAASQLAGEAEGNDYWMALRDQELAFFAGDAALVRVSLPPAAPADLLPGEQLIDWGGALRWLRLAPDATLTQTIAAAGGSWQLPREGLASPQSPALLALQQRIKQAFDPDNHLPALEIG